MGRPRSGFLRSWKSHPWLQEVQGSCSAPCSAELDSPLETRQHQGHSSGRGTEIQAIYLGCRMRGLAEPTPRAPALCTSRSFPILWEPYLEHQHCYLPQSLAISRKRGVWRRVGETTKHRLKSVGPENTSQSWGSQVKGPPHLTDWSRKFRAGASVSWLWVKTLSSSDFYEEYLGWTR